MLLDGREVTYGPYGVKSIPTVFFIDKEGKVQAVDVGGTESSLKKNANLLVGKKG